MAFKGDFFNVDIINNVINSPFLLSLNLHKMCVQVALELLYSLGFGHLLHIFLNLLKKRVIEVVYLWFF